MICQVSQPRRNHLPALPGRSAANKTPPPAIQAGWLLIKRSAASPRSTSANGVRHGSMFCASAMRCAAACATKCSRRCASRINLSFMLIVHRRESSCCRSLNSSSRLAANSLGMVFALCMAKPHATIPISRKNPASDPSTSRRCVSQNAATSSMVASTKPTPRQNRAVRNSTSSDITCSRSSSRSVDSRSSRVCAMATSVVARTVSDSSSPLLPPGVFSGMEKRLAPADEQTDQEADSGADSDRLPWIFVHISVGSLGRRSGFGNQCCLRLHHPVFHYPERFFRLGAYHGQLLTALVGGSLQQRFRICYYYLEIGDQLFFGDFIR